MLGRGYFVHLSEKVLDVRVKKAYSFHMKRNWSYSRDKDDGEYIPHSYVNGPSIPIHCAGGNLDQAEPDMLLIAAAPKMLDALRKIDSCADSALRMNEYGKEDELHKIQELVKEFLKLA